MFLVTSGKIHSAERRQQYQSFQESLLMSHKPFRQAPFHLLKLD